MGMKSLLISSLASKAPIGGSFLQGPNSVPPWPAAGHVFHRKEDRSSTVHPVRSRLAMLPFEHTRRTTLYTALDCGLESFTTASRLFFWYTFSAVPNSLGNDIVRGGFLMSRATAALYLLSTRQPVTNEKSIKPSSQ